MTKQQTPDWRANLGRWYAKQNGWKANKGSWIERPGKRPIQGYRGVYYRYQEEIFDIILRWESR